LRVFAFSPDYIEVATGTTTGVEVTLTYDTSKTLKRFTDANGHVKFPIGGKDGILDYWFAGVEFGQVLAPSGYTNSESKLLKAGKTLTISADAYDTLTYTFNVIWGALQIGQTEPTVEEIYRFGASFPLTITQNQGAYVWDNMGVIDANCIGKDIFLNSNLAITQVKIQIQVGEVITTYKTYNIKDLEACNGIYLRWIYKGEYKYFLFNIGTEIDEVKDGSTIHNNVWSLDASTDGAEIKSDIQLKDKSGNPTYECGVPSATYNQQLHLIGLQRSIKQWVYENSVWVECSIKMNPIVVNRFKSNIEVSLTVIKPSLYIESL
jgi:GTPase SAR1 family protein